MTRTEKDRVQSVTIVTRRSGPGYRLVLRLLSRAGTPVLETLPDSFESVEAAQRHAIEQLHVDPATVRITGGAVG